MPAVMSSMVSDTPDKGLIESIVRKLDRIIFQIFENGKDLVMDRNGPDRGSVLSFGYMHDTLFQVNIIRLHSPELFGPHSGVKKDQGDLCSPLVTIPQNIDLFRSEHFSVNRGFYSV